MTVIVDSLADFTLEQFRRVAWLGEPVEIGRAARQRIAAARGGFMGLLESDPTQVIYGVTTGYGSAANELLDAEGRARQAKLPPYSLGIGLGERLPERVVRGIVFARLASFVSGHAAVSPEIVEAVAGMLDGRPLPAMFLEGQIASGEMYPLNALFGALIGEGCAEKDGGSLVNGAPCSAALLGDVVLRARNRLTLAHQVFALSIEACRAPLEAYDPALGGVWSNPYDTAALTQLNAQLRGAEPGGRLPGQAPVSWRILPRVLGQLHRVLAGATESLAAALGSAGDNPLYLFPDAAHPLGRMLSNGSFHDCAPYWAIDSLGFAWAELTILSGRHAVKLHDPKIIGPDAVGVGAIEPTTIGDAMSARTAPRSHLTRPLTHSHSWFSRKALELARPTFLPVDDAGDFQSDVLMPSFYAFEKEGEIAGCLDCCLAILAAVASQVLWDEKRDPAPPLTGFLAEVRDLFPPAETLRDLGRDLERLRTALAARSLAAGGPGDAV